MDLDGLFRTNSMENFFVDKIQRYPQMGWTQGGRLGVTSTPKFLTPPKFYSNISYWYFKIIYFRHAKIEFYIVCYAFLCLIYVVSELK